MSDNPYYEYFKQTLQSSEEIEQKGGKFYSPAIGHIYEAPPFFRGRGLAGPAHSIRGGGIGNILGRLFKWSQPLLRSLGKKVFDSATNIAANVAQDAIQGENVIESTKKHGVSEGKHFLKEIPGQIGDFLSNKPATSSSERSVALIPVTEKGVIEKKAVKRSSTARNATRASSKRPFFSQRKTGRGGIKRPKKQRGSGFSAIYPALQFMQ